MKDHRDTTVSVVSYQVFCSDNMFLIHVILYPFHSLYQVCKVDVYTYVKR